MEVNVYSCSVTMDDQYALLNVQNQGLHLWDIKCNSLVIINILFAHEIQ